MASLEPVGRSALCAAGGCCGSGTQRIRGTVPAHPCRPDRDASPGHLCPGEVIWVTPRWGRSSSSAWAMWVTAQAIRLAYRVVRPLSSGTCRSSSVTPRTCATLSRTSAEVCGRPSACSSSTGRIMDWKSGTVISVLMVDRQRYSRACQLGQARQAVAGRGDNTLSGRRFQCASADPTEVLIHVVAGRLRYSDPLRDHGAWIVGRARQP